MASPDIQELNQRAAQLRSLADHIDSMVDAAKKHSVIGMKSWAGPNSDNVRGKLRTWRTTCGSVARTLRDEAQQCVQDAKDLQDKRR